MWLSRQMMQQQPVQDAAAIGRVSIGGKNTAVVTDGEKRRAAVIAPGGYVWQPQINDSVMVIRSNEDYIPGTLVTPNGLLPGEVKIFSKGTEIFLHNDGSVTIRGNVNVEGTLRVNGREVMLR